MKVVAVTIQVTIAVEEGAPEPKLMELWATLDNLEHHSDEPLHCAVTELLDKATNQVEGLEHGAYTVERDICVRWQGAKE